MLSEKQVLTEDARPITPTNPLGAGRPRLRGLKAGTTGAKVSGAKRTLTGQLLSKTFGPEIWQVGAVESVTIPYEIENIETGITVQAELVDKLLPNVSKALTPVSSSNVRGIGTWNNELLIQFHPNKLTPMRTYRYNLNTPEGAQEAFQSLLTSGSPGRWVWRFIRGHNKGENVSSSKLAPSLSPPGKGLPTIGGTSASLLPYKISNRTPTGRIAKFEELSRKLKKHITPSPFTDPETGSRVEGYLGAVRGFRDLGLKRLDFTAKLITKKIGICEGCKEKKELFYQKLCKECYLKRVENYIEKYDFVYDFVDLGNFEVIDYKKDFTEDFTLLHGPIVRDGPYDYIKNGQKITVYKDYDNLKEIYSRYDVLPVKVSEIGAHYGEEIGFSYNFIPNEDTHEIYAYTILLKDFKDLKENYHVSPGYHDRIDGNIQFVLDVDHIALSLGDTEQSRACTGINAFGKSCTLVSPILINHDQNRAEVVSNN